MKLPELSPERMELVNRFHAANDAHRLASTTWHAALALLHRPSADLDAEQLEAVKATHEMGVHSKTMDIIRHQLAILDKDDMASPLSRSETVRLARVANERIDTLHTAVLEATEILGADYTKYTDAERIERAVKILLKAYDNE